MINKFEKYNKTFNFFVVNPEDTIQRCHAKGFFYEEEELVDLKLSIPNNSHILDVGANVGNHSVFFSNVCRAKKVICIEPNPAAIYILKKNILLNNISDIVDINFLGIALGKEVGSGFVDLPERMNGNLGAASVQLSTNGDIKVLPGDQLFYDLEFLDLIKIDVEGAEFDVLSGLESTITKFRPALYIEIQDRNLPLFEGWLSSKLYRIDRTHSRHRGLKNYLCFPR